MTSGFDLGHDLDLEFSRSNIEFAISQPKMVRFPRNEKKHSDWTLGIKCDQRVWPWPWPWPWIFKVKYRICYISAKNGPIATKQKANISIELQASNVTNGMDLPDSDWGDLSCRRAVDSSSFSLFILISTSQIALVDLNNLYFHFPYMWSFLFLFVHIYLMYHDSLLEYWIEHFTFGLLYFMFTCPTRIFYRGVPGLVTDCPCGVWCLGLTTCLLYVGPLLGNLV